MLEAVEAVHEAVAASPSEEPPLPPYPDIGDLSISGKKDKYKLTFDLTYIYNTYLLAYFDGRRGLSP